MKVIIYGLGKEALFVSRVIKKEHTIMGFTDSFAQIKVYCGYPYYDRNKLEKVDFDYIIIALNNRKNSEIVSNELIARGINACCIVDFFKLHTMQRVDKVMAFGKEKLDGLILGISHAAVGINTDYLKGEWCNLASPSEDLYYHYKVLEKCIENYADKIQNLKYAIIDLYDYTIFDYDTSMSSAALAYWGCGGYMEDLHHFDENTRYKGNVEDEMYLANYYSPISSEAEKNISELLFNKNLIHDFLNYMDIEKLGGIFGFNTPIYMRFNGSICKEPSLQYNLYTMGEQSRPNTRAENIYVLEETIKMLKMINPQIKIVFLLMPRYGKLELYHSYILKNCREEFEKIMGSFLKIENCYFMNFKDTKEISDNNHFYYDVAHLNYIGAIAFTDILNNCISRLSDHRN